MVKTMNILMIIVRIIVRNAVIVTVGSIVRVGIESGLQFVITMHHTT